MDLGVDYLYQVNDDVELLTSDWEAPLIEQLATRNNFGVTGPEDRGNGRILTQSFVHKTHVQIFDAYFAEPFKNWFSDDWLTLVYGASHTYRKHPVKVHHRASLQRYPTDDKAAVLHAEVQKGRQRIVDWIAQNPSRQITFT